MQLNVFVTRVDGALQTSLLVLPISPQAAIPAKYRSGWTYYATVDSRDRMFGDVDAIAIETEISHSGFAVVGSQVPDRR